MYSEDYTFYVKADDSARPPLFSLPFILEMLTIPGHPRCRLWVNGRLLFDKWDECCQDPRSSSVQVGSFSLSRSSGATSGSQPVS